MFCATNNHKEASRRQCLVFRSVRQRKYRSSLNWVHDRGDERSWQPFAGPAGGSLVRKCACRGRFPGARAHARGDCPDAGGGSPGRRRCAAYGLLPPPGAPPGPPEAAASTPALTYSEGLVTSGAAAAANSFRGPAWTAHAQRLPARSPPARGGFPPASEHLLWTPPRPACLYVLLRHLRSGCGLR